VRREREERRRRNYPSKNKRNGSFLGVVGVGWGREGVDHQKHAKTACR
jgi:hypothetical protein